MTRVRKGPSTRRNILIEDSLWEAVNKRAIAEGRPSATNMIETFIRAGLKNHVSLDYLDLINMLIMEVEAAWRQREEPYSNVSIALLKKLIKMYRIDRG